MEAGGARQGKGVLRRPLRLLVALTFADLAAFLVAAYAHALTSEEVLVLPAEVLGAALGLLAGAALLVGVAHAWLAYPQHRRPVAFVVAITLATLLAHAYVIGTPTLSSQQSVAGAVGTTIYSSFKDDLGHPQLTVSSTLEGEQLSVTVQATGDLLYNGKAYAYPTLITPQATGPGFSSQPSFGSPLEPGSSATGTWTVTGRPTEINVTFAELDCYDAKSQSYGCIMDEIYYVPYGMTIFAGTQCFTGGGAPNGCHLEHPPLAPALIAAGMEVFGEYNVVGWRMMPAILGSFSIPLLFGMAWKASGNKKIGYLSATLLSLDVMFFAQSGAAVLDIPEVFFILAGFFAYFAKLRVWKLDRYVIAGVLFGLAGLAKEVAVFMLLAFMTYILLFEEGSRRSRIDSVLKVSLLVGLVLVGGLQAYDSALATSAYPNFLHNVNYILGYGSGLTTGCPWNCGWSDAATGGYITPLNWFTYYSPVAYFKVYTTYIFVSYYGVTNLLVSWTVFDWVPLAANTLYRYSRRPKGTPGAQPPDEIASAKEREAKFAGLALVTFLWGYLPYYVILFLMDRVTNPFYVIPAIHAIAMGAAFWVSRDWFPKKLMAVYLVMVFVFFLIYFPDKGFLPVWLRIIIGH